MKIKIQNLKLINKLLLNSFNNNCNCANIDKLRFHSSHLNRYSIKSILESEQIMLSQFISDKLKNIDIRHPFVNTSKRLFGGQPNYSETIDSLTLCHLSKIANSHKTGENEHTLDDKQITYIEIYELLDKAFDIHQNGIINVNKNDKLAKKQNAVNNLAVLSGDTMIGLATKKMATVILDHYLYKKAFDMIDNFCVQQFVGKDEGIGNKLMALKNMNLYDWEQRSGHCNALLFANWCEGIIYLTDVKSMHRSSSLQFGYNLRLAHNLRQELKSIEFKDFERLDDLNILPLIIEINENPKVLEYFYGLVTEDKLNREIVKQALASGNSLIKCEQILNNYKDKSLGFLESFPHSNSKSILKEIVMMA